jgi:glycosyltransferase involved in cell wall biosynthesis
MSTPPLFSVVVPLWNKEREIVRAISSVLTQSIRDLEVIVVNDGSTDGSRAAADTIDDPRVRLLDQPNQGVSVARNTGIARATAPCIAFLDADDEWLPDFLERIAGLMQHHPNAAVFATGSYIDMGGHDIRPARVSGIPRDFHGIVPNYFHTTGLLGPSWTVVRRAALAAVGGFREHVSFGEDADIWLRLASQFQVAFDSHASAVWHCDASNRASHREVGSSAHALRLSLHDIESSTNLPSHIKRDARYHVACIELAEIQRFLIRGESHFARTLLQQWRILYTPSAKYYLLLLGSLCPPQVVASIACAASRAGSFRRLFRTCP